MDFQQQYSHPLWQKMRLERLEAANFECENCGDDSSRGCSFEDEKR